MKTVDRDRRLTTRSPMIRMVVVRVAVTVGLLGVAAPAWCQAPSQSGPAEVADAVASDGLRWTPHRSRRTSGSPSSQPGERLASTDPDGLRGVAAPEQRSAASVVLDEGLERLRPEEPVPGMPPFAVAAPARPPLAPTADPNQASARGAVAGPLRAGIGGGGLSFPPFPSVMPNMVVRRAPQGDIARPQPTSGTSGVRGGLPEAPLFRPAFPQPATRVAINADGVPSVMAKPDPRGVSDPIPSPDTPTRPSAATPQAPSAAPRLPASEGVAPDSAAPRAAEQPQQRVAPSPEAAAPDFGAGSFTSDSTGSMGGYDGVAIDEQGMPSHGMWMGGYPSAACGTCGPDECCDEECGFLPCLAPSGRCCAFLRQFGQPYYGWKWHRDLTASVGVTSFQTPADLGLFGNYGTNEYINWAMPFWNAFGIGWQLGVRGVQTNFQRTTATLGDIGDFGSSVRDQFFLTTGFFTRAFEGRGLQFGAAWDYLQDDWIDNVDVAQVRAEISYVWHAHEVGFWGAFQYDTVPFTGHRLSGQATTYELFNAFYRLQFGDANEWKVWGGATQNGDGYLGTLVRAPMTRSLALEGTFAYLIPKDSTRYSFEGGSVSFTDAAWNISANVVFYPGCRSRRSLASPYRPLFDVADNGTMIRSIEGLRFTP